MSAPGRRLPRATVALVCLAAVWVGFGIAIDRVFTFANVASVASQLTVLGLLAVGQMAAITVRGFDISVGATAALASTCAAIGANGIGPAGFLAGPLAGLFVGALNGALVARLQVQPIIATLGTLIGCRGLATLISDNGQVVPLTDPSAVTWLAYGRWLGFAPSVWLVGLVVLAAAAFIHATLLGRRMVMVGSNPDAAALVGIDVAAVEASAYRMCGLFAGLAGLVMVTRAGGGLPADAGGLELQSIAAAVIGGTALSGGITPVFGTLVGAGFIQSLLSSLNLAGVSPFSAEIAVGAVIIAASCAASAPALFGRIRSVSNQRTIP